jgi:hypothetical protein
MSKVRARTPAAASGIFALHCVVAISLSVSTLSVWAKVYLSFSTKYRRKGAESGVGGDILGLVA